MHNLTHYIEILPICHTVSLLLLSIFEDLPEKLFILRIKMSQYLSPVATLSFTRQGTFEVIVG